MKSKTPRHGDTETKMRHGRLAIWICAAVVFFAASPSASGKDLDKLIQTIEEQQKKIQTLSAKFAQKKETALAKKPLLSSGVVKFKRPDRVHFLYSRPETMEMAMEGDSLLIFTPGNSQAERYSLSRGRAARLLSPVTSVFQKTFARLGDEYLLTYEGPGEEGTLRFVLHPREENLRRLLARIELWIDKNSGAILKFRTLENKGDRLTLAFQDLQINPPLTDDDLKIKIPQTVRVREGGGP